MLLNGSLRLEKYLKMKVCLEKVLQNEIYHEKYMCTWKLLKGLEAYMNFMFFCHL